ncbi:MAG: polysaccharide deacetylase family protein [[Clostridium] symbiosum]
MREDFNTIINYIIMFLTGSEESVEMIAYSKEPNLTVPITIIDSGFFDNEVYMTEKSMPSLPLAKWHGVPLLYGKDNEVILQGHYVIYADIIASSYFLLSRYEECINRKNRDEHGRFLGKLSLPYREKFIDRPIIDEYGQCLRLAMSNLGIKVKVIKEGISHIYLTHDVDEVWQWDNLLSAFRTFAKRLIYNQPRKLESIFSLLDYKNYDSIYTFPYFNSKYQYLKQRMSFGNITEIYFVKGGGDSAFDNNYYQNTNRFKELINFIEINGAKIGLHSSYSAGIEPSLINYEKDFLEKISEKTVKWNRNHYLASREPEDMEYLIRAGITDDFTMGYADITGFRLGTCRATIWIDPVKKEMTPLILHPLTLMDCTLNQKNYMNLDYEDAIKVVHDLLSKIYKYNGEFNVLWHNNSVAQTSGGYLRKLYESMIQLLIKKYDEREEEYL